MTNKWDRYQWTPKRENFLIANWGILSSADIAARLSTNVDVIIGKAHRMGLPKLSNPRLRPKAKPGIQDPGL